MPLPSVAENPTVIAEDESDVTPTDTDPELVVTTHVGVESKFDPKVIVHAVTTPLPMVTVPAMLLPTTEGDEPHDDTEEAVPVVTTFVVEKMERVAVPVVFKFVTVRRLFVLSHERLDDVASADDPLPIIRDPDVIEVQPVPPYMTPIDVVAPTTPPLAWSGPESDPIVSEPENVFAPVKAFAVYILGIVVEAWMNDCTSESA